MKKKTIGIVIASIVVVLGIVLFIRNNMDKTGTSFYGNVYNHSVSGSDLEKLKEHTTELEELDIKIYEDFFKDLSDECGNMFDVSFYCTIEDVQKEEIADAILEIELGSEVEQLIFAEHIDFRGLQLQDADSDNGFLSVTYDGVTRGKSIEELKELFSNVEYTVKVKREGKEEYEVLEKGNKFSDNFNSQVHEDVTVMEHYINIF